MSQKPKSSPFRKIWKLLTSAEKKNAAVVLCLMFVGMALETLGVSLVIPALALFTQDDIAHAHPGLQPFLNAIGNPSQSNLVIGGMLVLVGVYLVKTLFLAFLAWWQTRFAFGVQAQLSQRLFNIYLGQPYTFHLQRNSAQLIRNVFNEVNLFTFNCLLPGMLILAESLVMLGLCSLLLVVEPIGTVVLVMTFGGAAWGFNKMTRSHITKWGKARQSHDGLRLQHLQQGLGGVKDVKLLGREAEFSRQFTFHNFHSAKAAQLQATLQQLPRLWLELLAVGALAILVVVMLIQGRGLDGILPTLGLFAAAAFRLMPSVNRVLTSIQAMRYGLPVIETLHEELELKESRLVAATPSDGIFSNALEFVDVSYSYPDAVSPSLNHISITMCRGESIGFIGASGAGKSTLVDVLLGLLQPDHGEIRVDGKNIQENLRTWQSQIGYVPQSIFLTDDTLRRNVAFGLPEERIDDDAIMRAIKAAQLEEFLTGLPDGLETMVGERGIRLSGGQRQRIGIARALYHDPGILVLDEATSSLDTSTEQDVMEAVRALQGKKTTIIVAHRLSTIAHCDRLYRLQGGIIVEEGAPDSMLNDKTGPEISTETGMSSRKS
ncbi:ABC transporter ATP-binding protein [Oxalicibacterium solurbis]|uniref:Cyclolysin secretion/processing ATP-binding protein CyaB n=1 Tax=Oxalicibacterium solurbis TaxID=69280 RepID=A0A8J3F5T7_9BURK|nr:ABC transporter ATP-binding protein [Oxalicibacterium solurbis]GGI54424.1 ABC transporter ATP-binding protein [Oxalicibacterium solurbis]